MNELYTIFNKLKGAYADSTIRAYAKNIENYQKYCQQHNVSVLPSQIDTVVGFIDHLLAQNLSAYYIRRHVTAIAHIHRMSHRPDPTTDPDIKIAMRRAFRKQGRYQQQAYPIHQNIIDTILTKLENNLYGARDRVLLLIAYESLLRRSEMIDLRVEDLKTIQHPQYHAKILLRKSKTDPFKEGRWLYISANTYQSIYARWWRSILEYRSICYSHTQTSHEWSD